MSAYVFTLDGLAFGPRARRSGHTLMMSEEERREADRVYEKVLETLDTCEPESVMRGLFLAGWRAGRERADRLKGGS